MLDLRSKNRIMPIVIYALSIFFTITSFLTIFANVSTIRFARNNDEIGWNSEYNFIFNWSMIALVLVLLALVAIVFNLLIKNSNKCDKSKKISDLAVIITSLLAAIILLASIFIMRANLPTWESGDIRMSSFNLFTELKVVLLQPIMTLFIIGAIHLYDFFVNSKKVA